MHDRGARFRDLHAQFRKAGATVVGVSRDSLKSHEHFKTKMQFPFDLISDTDEKLCAQFDVIRIKNMYGKVVRGIERPTFLIDGERLLVREWRKLKVDGHVEEVLAAARSVEAAPKSAPRTRQP